MKKAIIWAAIAAFATTSCSKTESLDNTVTKQTIDFSAPGIGKQTKAPISGTTYPTDVPFGVFSYMLVADKAWPDYKADAAILMNNTEISYQTSVWKATTGGPYYWPSDAGSSLSFICYSPKSTPNVSYDISNADGLTVTDYVNDGSTDLMYSDEIANQKHNTSNGVVAPLFHHALTQIHFTVQTSDEYDDATVTIKSIKLNTIINKGTFKANPGATPSWTLEGSSTGTFTAYEDATGQTVTDSEATIGSALVMLPQSDLTAQGQTITIVYELTGQGVANETVTKTVVLTGSWGRNQKIKYQISINLTEIIFNPTVNDWATEVDRPL